MRTQHLFPVFHKPNHRVAFIESQRFQQFFHVLIFQIGNIFYSQLIPFACCKVADPKILGSFSVLRIVTMQGAEALCTLVFSAVIAQNPPIVIIAPVLLSLLFQMICCDVAYRNIPSEAGCLMDKIKLKLKRRTHK